MIFVVIDCGDPCPPRNGYVTVINTTKLNSEAVYTCNGGCTPLNKNSSSVVATCSLGGIWSESELVCPGLSVMEHSAQ